MPTSSTGMPRCLARWMMRLQVVFHLRRGKATKPVVGAERQDEQPHIAFERPVRAPQAIGRRVSRNAGVDHFERVAALLQLSLKQAPDRPAPRKSKPGRQAVAKHDDARRRRRCAGDAESRPALRRPEGGGSGAEPRRRKSPQAQGSKGEREPISSILLSYTAVGGHHRLSAGAGARTCGPRARPPCRRSWGTHAGPQVVRAETRRRTRTAMHARRSVASGRRRRAGASAILGRPPDALARRLAARAAVGDLAPARPHRLCQGRSVARHRAARPRAPLRRAGARFRSHRPGSLRAGAVLQAGRRHGDRPRAHRQGRVCAARRRRPPPPRAASTRSRASCSRRAGAIDEAIDRAAPGGAARDGGAGRRRARHHLQQPGERRADSSTVTIRRSRSPSAAWRCRSRSARDTASPLRSPRSARFCVRLGELERAEKVLHRALEVRSPIQFHEMTGAVFDTLAQIALMRGDYESAGDYLRQAGEAYGGYGAQTSQWYEWSMRVLEAQAGDPPGRDRRSAAPGRRNRRRRSGAAGRSDPGRPDRVRGAAGRRPRRRSGGAAGSASADASTRAPCRAPGASFCACAARCTRSRAAVGGVPRLRAERERVRAARRALSGGAQPPRARPARRPQPARDRRPTISSSAPRRSSSRSAQRATSSKRRRPRAQIAADGRRRDTPCVAARRRRCDRPAPGGCGGVSRAARRAKPPRRCATALDAECARGLRRAARRRHPAGGLDRLRRRARADASRARGAQAAARHGLGRLPPSDRARRRRPALRRGSLAAARWPRPRGGGCG